MGRGEKNADLFILFSAEMSEMFRKHLIKAHLIKKRGGDEREKRKEFIDNK